MPSTLYINHPTLVGLPQTFLAYASNKGDADLIVQNSAGFTTNTYVVTGQYGDPESQVLLIPGPSPDNTTIQCGNIGFSRPVDTPINLIPFNTIRIYRSLTGVGGTYAYLTSVPIQVEQNVSVFTDWEAVSPYSYKYTFFNSVLNVQTDFSSEMPYDGFPLYSLASITRRVLGLFVDANGEFISQSSIADWVNELVSSLNREVTDSESALFANFVIFTPGTAEYTSLSPYSIEAIHLVEYSSDGGATFKDTINPMDSRILAQNPISVYSYKMLGDNFFVYPSFPSNYMVRVWYYGEQPILSMDGDPLPAVYRSFSDMFVDYCMMRANEQSRRISESATYFDKKFMMRSQEAIESVRARLNQGNKSMATTWLNDFPNW